MSTAVVLKTNMNKHRYHAHLIECAHKPVLMARFIDISTLGSFMISSIYIVE